MRGIALHRLDQVRDQVVALLELHVDIGKGLADALAQRYQAVVGAERQEHEDDDDAENDPAGRHGELLKGEEGGRSLDQIGAEREPRCRGEVRLGRIGNHPSSRQKGLTRLTFGNGGGGGLAPQNLESSLGMPVASESRAATLPASWMVFSFTGMSCRFPLSSST